MYHKNNIPTCPLVNSTKTLLLKCALKIYGQDYMSFSAADIGIQIQSEFWHFLDPRTFLIQYLLMLEYNFSK